ncbi:MAG: TlpA family protein disulfide reductase [Candidatus Limnocylindria bacterium]
MSAANDAAREAVRFPRPIAALIVGAIALATVAAFFWPSLPREEGPLVPGPSNVGVIVRQVEGGPTAARIGERPPDFEWVRPDGSRASLATLAGRPVVINFWATWCLPCREEMPILEEAAAANPEWAFLAVDLDEDGDRIRAFFDELGLVRLEPVLDVGLSTARRYGLASVPSTFFVDADGTIRHIQIGEMDEELLERGLGKVR